MNKITTISTMAAVLLAGACSKAVVEQAGSAVTLDYTVSVTEAATKALGDGSNVDKMAYAVYDGETCVKREVIDEQQEGKFAFQPALYYGKTYRVAMFAYEDGAYNVSDLKAITKSADDETADAFTHTETVMIDHNGDLYINGVKSAEQTTKHAVTLTRPVAQLAIGSVETTGAMKVRVTLGENYKAVSYNAVSGTCAQGTVSPFTSEIKNLGTFKIDDIDYTVVTCNYFFPMDQNVNVMIEVLNTNDNLIRTIKLTDVPLRANKKTQIYGNLVKGELTFNVTVSAGFDTWDPSDKGKVEIDE